MGTKIFESFLSKIEEFPFWVKEVIYITLRDNFEKYPIAESELNSDKEDLYQYFVPALTYAGKKEVVERSAGLPETHYRFLELAEDNASIAEITLKSFWTLEETAKINIDCIERQLVIQPVSVRTLATVLYIAGKIKMGDYFKRVGKITIDQLDTAIRKQKEIENNGDKIKLANIMINLGYLTEDETKAILYVKEESKKRFIFNANVLGKSVIAPEPVAEKAETKNEKINPAVALLRKENFDLTEKIKAIRAALDK